MPETFCYEVNNIAELDSLAKDYASKLQAPCMILLNGPLGAGKTTFIQKLVSALGIEDKVTSPTFSKMHEYVGQSFIIYHLDLYRALTSIGELEEICGQEHSIICIEWASRLEEKLQQILRSFSGQVWNLDIVIKSETEREFKFVKNQ
jgi:tRNA threonylcarbamoyladenosine biosynthesis protein TsaE